MGSVRKRAPSEKLLLTAVFLLSVIGLIVLASTSVPLSQQNFGESYFYFKHQLIFGFGVGIIFFLIASKVSIKFLRKMALPLFGLSVLLLAAVFIPQLGLEIGGSKRWISIGGLTFQPAELAKLALIVYLASWLARHSEKIRSSSSVISFLVIVGAIGGLVIAQRDLGTAVLIFIISLIMYYVAGAKKQSIALAILASVLAFSIFVAIEPYRISRITSFLNPSSDIQGESYQLNQAFIAIGSGGFFGLGLGHSIQKYQYLPESIGDAIFAIIGEELGFVGASVILGLFLLFILAGLKMALRARTRFGTLLVVGLVSWIGLQTIINIAGISGLIPFTGIPLPFISYGGTAIVAEFTVVGLAINAARN